MTLNTSAEDTGKRNFRNEGSLLVDTSLGSLFVIIPGLVIHLGNLGGHNSFWRPDVSLGAVGRASAAYSVSGAIYAKDASASRFSSASDTGRKIRPQS